MLAGTFSNLDALRRISDIQTADRTNGAIKIIEPLNVRDAESLDTKVSPPRIVRGLCRHGLGQGQSHVPEIYLNP